MSTLDPDDLRVCLSQGNLKPIVNRPSAWAVSIWGRCIRGRYLPGEVTYQPAYNDFYCTGAIYYPPYVRVKF